MNDDIKKSSKKISTRIKERKVQFLEIIEKYPNIQLACEKVGITRTTYYRWINEDIDFNDQVNKNKMMGIGTINDIAESNIISGVRNNDMKANIIWLNNNHPNYSNRPIQNTSVYITDPRKHSKAIESILRTYSKTNDRKSKGKTEKGNLK